MGVRKIFIVLVTIVACVILGAFVLNVLMPNVVTTVINATEDMIFNATGMSFDFNGDGRSGQTSDGSGYNGEVGSGVDEVTGVVDGFNTAAG